MGKLWEHARLIRSKNAGPWELTIDVICDNERDFDEKLQELFGDLHPFDTD